MSDKYEEMSDHFENGFTPVTHDDLELKVAYEIGYRDGYSEGKTLGYKQLDEDLKGIHLKYMNALVKVISLCDEADADNSFAIYSSKVREVIDQALK